MNTWWVSSEMPRGITRHHGGSQGRELSLRLGLKNNYRQKLPCTYGSLQSQVLSVAWNGSLEAWSFQSEARMPAPYSPGDLELILNLFVPRFLLV